MNMKGKMYLFISCISFISVIIVFSLQHRLSYSTYPVHETWRVENPSATIILKEVTIQKFSNRMRDFRDRPWYMELIDGKPMWLARPILLMDHFFTLPHRFNHGEIKVKGIVTGNEKWSDEFRIVILLDDVTYRPHKFSRTGNLFYFSSDEIPSEGFNPEKITIQLYKPGEGLIKEHSLNMESGGEQTIFDLTQQLPPEYGFDPTDTATRFVFDTLQKGKQEVSTQVHPAVKENFPWSSFPKTFKDGKFILMNPTPEFEGSYQDFDEVYSVHLAYSLPEDRTHKIVGEQKIYLIQVENQWKVIDLSPYREN